jgi:ABC-type branched-subunit amino acid transport system ATPase component/branched-subunit amino acid ABC-type transport system permease component
VLTFISLVLSGCVSGAIYALLGVGLTISYSTAKVFNFGHAAVAFATAYVFYQLNSGLHWNVWVTLIVTVGIFAPGVGYLWHHFVFRNLRDADEIARTVCGLGVLLVMPALVQLLGDIGGNDFHIPFINTSQVVTVPGLGPTPPAEFHVFASLVLSSDQLIALGSGIAASMAAWALLRFSRLGLQMRASVDSQRLAGLRGIRNNRVSAVAWVLSFAVAGVAGVAAAPLIGTFGLIQNSYTTALFVAITCVVVARYRSVPVAFAAGLAIGALIALTEGYLTPTYLGAVGSWVESIPGLSSAVPYIILFLALVVPGYRLSTARVAGTTASASPPPAYLRDLSPLRRRLPWIIASGAVLAYGLFLANPIWSQVVISGAATGIILLSFTLLTGLGGFVSFAQASLAGLAALIAGYLTSNGWNFFLALITATVICVAAGAVFALPALRLGGLAIAFMTLALALVLNLIVLQNSTLNNNGSGWALPRPSIGALSFSNNRLYLILVSLIFGVAFWLVCRFSKTSAGRAVTALRSSEPAARSAGVSPVITRMAIFGVAAGFAAVGGVLLGDVGGGVSATTFPTQQGFFWLALVVVFGVNRPAGAAVAAMVGAAFPLILEVGIHIGTFGWNGTGLSGYTTALLPSVLFGLAAVGLSKHPYGSMSQAAERRYLKRQRRKEAQAAGPDTTGAAGRTAREVPVPLRCVEDLPAAADDRDCLLSLRGIRAGYGEVQVLHGVDLRVMQGETIAIVGSNGAGKSTLANVIGGVVPVTGGTLTFDGNDLSKIDAARRTDAGIMLIPESRGLFPGLTVSDNLLVTLPHKRSHDQVYDRFPALAARRNIAAGNLSGGEQQMLSLAPFFVAPPRLLVVDEPTLGLSPIVSKTVIDALLELKRSGVTLLVVEEKAKETFALADRVVAMSRGTVKWARPVSSVREQDMQAAYLGV